MAKRTAVIDIGSNSARLVIFQKTSRYGFHLLCQHKSRVRIGEGAYRRDGYLQPVPMERAYKTLESFAKILQEYQVKKTLCVATSALRDAPNRSDFIKRVSDNLGIRIQVIDGTTEAQYGAIAAKNLLVASHAVTIDIGGGSADMARIENNKIVETFSLNLGTVRLKELFTEHEINLDKARAYIHDELNRLPDTFRSKVAIGIGGTARTLAKAIMSFSDYPLDKLHAFDYSTKEHQSYFDQVIQAKTDALETLSIKPDRFDTIREGALILREILKVLGAREVITSGVGVREGVYLHDRLLKDDLQFPSHVNPSIQSIRDRFDLLGFPQGKKHEVAEKLFDLFSERFGGDAYDKRIVMQALDLSNIGKMLTTYKEHQHAYYIAMQELNFGFTHSDMILISLILRSKDSRKFHKKTYQKYQELLPKKNKIRWLVFVYTLTLILHENSSEANAAFAWKAQKRFWIDKTPLSYLAQEEIKRLAMPEKIRIEIS